MYHGGVIIEKAARMRQPGEGSQEEAARRHQETPRRRQKAPRRPLGGTHLRFSPLSRLSKRLIKKLSNNSSNSNSNSNRLLVIIVPP
mgnify:CR=1 FL=1